MVPTRTSPVSFLKLAAEVASFYGFRGVRDIEKTLKNAPPVRSALSFADAAALSGARASQTPREPSLLFYATPVPSHIPHTLTAAQNIQEEFGEFGLCATSGETGPGEVLVLKTLAAIASEWGAPLSKVRFNALGDKESRERHTREMGSYLRRNASALHQQCRDTAPKNPSVVKQCGHEQCQAALNDAPRTVNYLSEKSRGHFRRVLEHIETLGLPYEIDDLLTGDERDPHIVFAADFAKPDTTLVSTFGGRFDDYLRRISGKRDQAAVSASIYFRKRGAARGSFPLEAPKRAPKLHFVQLGSLAKLQGLAVLDMLRLARMPVAQAFDSSGLSPQRMPGGHKVSHIIIMGQREALDGTVIIRTLKNGSQTTVELTRLPRILKTLRV